MRKNDSEIDILAEKTKKLALVVLKFIDTLPKNEIGRVVRYQLTKAGTSVGANYRAARRARSKADFIAKMGIVEEEADEVMYWMEILIESKITKEDEGAEINQLADNILAMVVASIRTAKGAR